MPGFCQLLRLGLRKGFAKAEDGGLCAASALKIAVTSAIGRTRRSGIDEQTRRFSREGGGTYRVVVVLWPAGFASGQAAMTE